MEKKTLNHRAKSWAASFECMMGFIQVLANPTIALLSSSSPYRGPFPGVPTSCPVKPYPLET